MVLGFEKLQITKLVFLLVSEQQQISAMAKQGLRWQRPHLVNSVCAHAAAARILTPTTILQRGFCCFTWLKSLKRNIVANSYNRFQQCSINYTDGLSLLKIRSVFKKVEHPLPQQLHGSVLMGMPAVAWGWAGSVPALGAGSQGEKGLCSRGWDTASGASVLAATAVSGGLSGLRGGCPTAHSCSLPASLLCQL